MNYENVVEAFDLVQKIDMATGECEVKKMQIVSGNSNKGYKKTDSVSTLKLVQTCSAESVLKIANSLANYDLSGYPEYTILYTSELLGFTNPNYTTTIIKTSWHDPEYVKKRLLEMKVIEEPWEYSREAAIKALQKYFNQVQFDTVEARLSVINNVSASITVTQSNSFDYKVVNVKNTKEVNIIMENKFVADIEAKLTNEAVQQAKNQATDETQETGEQQVVNTEQQQEQSTVEENVEAEVVVNEPPKSKKKLSAWAIALIVVGSILFIALVSSAVYLGIKRKHKLINSEFSDSVNEKVIETAESL